MNVLCAILETFPFRFFGPVHSGAVQQLTLITQTQADMQSKHMRKAKPALSSHEVAYAHTDPTRIAVRNKP